MGDLALENVTGKRVGGPDARVTRSLLGYGVLAGPFYVAVVLGQAFLRPGFDLLRDDASLLGLIAAGLFPADPMNGFPAGTPAGHPSTFTFHGIAHIVSAAVGFVALVAACFVVASRFAGEQRRAWAWFSRGAGTAFLLAFFGVASGSGSPAVVVAFWVGLLVAWGWLAALSIELYRRYETCA
jgi:hypothetical protein